MIVDLLRNDLGRICSHGTVRATRLFYIERFPTVLQMTSTIEGQLCPGTGFTDILRALFPSGSIVGAPKIRTMQILRDLERRNRGVYTGAIGYLAPNGDSTFSVAIRTAVLRKGHAAMGIGSGIVYDSNPKDEWQECRTKASFIHRATPPFELIETLLYNGGYTFLEEHLTRLSASARYFNFPFDRDHILAVLNAETRSFSCSGAHRVRLLLHPTGHATVTSRPIDLPPEESGVAILIASDSVSSSDHMLAHKTTARAVYEAAFDRAQSHRCADAIFFNERGELTEGAIHNIVVVRNGQWTTPPQDAGLLAGIYRAHLLRTIPQMREEAIRMDDLLGADEIYLCNSVRGLRRVTRILQEAPSSPRLVREL